MASRRLALNLSRALRNRAALNALPGRIRGFATPVNAGLTTESTTLSNGLTVRFLAVYVDQANFSFRLQLNILHGRRHLQLAFG